MSRTDLHMELLNICNNVYFQPPNNLQIKYPCIVYNKRIVDTKYADDKVYSMTQRYEVITMSQDPDSAIAQQIINTIPYCTISSTFVVDNVYHTTLRLYY